MGSRADLVMAGIIAICIFLLIVVTINAKLFAPFFTEGDQPMDTLDTTIMYGSLGLVHPADTKMTTYKNANGPVYEPLEKKHYGIIFVFGLLTYAIAGLASYKSFEHLSTGNGKFLPTTAQ